MIQRGNQKLSIDKRTNNDLPNILSMRRKVKRHYLIRRGESSFTIISWAVTNFVVQCKCSQIDQCSFNLSYQNRNHLWKPSFIEILPRSNILFGNAVSDYRPGYNFNGYITEMKYLINYGFQILFCNIRFRQTTYNNTS